MSQYRKLKASRVEINDIIVVHHPKKFPNPCGHLVKVMAVKGETLTVEVLSGHNEKAIINLSHEGVWAYDPSSADTHIHAEVKDFSEFPGFTPRMQKEGWNGKQFIFSPDELVKDDKEESPGCGFYFLRHVGETTKEDGSFYRNLFRMSNIHVSNPPEWRVSRAEMMGVEAVELPLPPKPARQGSESIIASITPWLAELNHSHGENVSHGKCSADFKKKKLYKKQACHRAVQESVEFPVEYLFTIGLNRCTTTSWNKGAPSDEALRLWVTYLTSYSPYADAFITKDPDYIIEYGYILDANAPSHLVVGGMFATRQVWERKARAEAMLEFYKGGLSLDEAFLFGCLCSSYDKGKMKLTESGSGHSHLYTSKLTDSCLLNFLEHTPYVKDKPYKEQIDPSSSSVGVDGMWSKDFNRKPCSKLIEKLMGIKKAGGDFNNALPIDEVVERAIEYITDWRQDNN